ncbi:hypothetical protein LguiB_005152 [Lonicera macranthoides]
MSQQNKQTNTSTSLDLPVKRKRGRPRKDENLMRKETTSPLPVTPPPSDGMKKIEQIKVNSSNSNIDTDMVGKVVSGVIEGTFDAGYFLSIRAGNNNTLMRGVVFQPGQFTPISAANDIAPQVKMYTRREFPTPAFNPQTPISTSIPQSSEHQSGSSPYAPNNQPASVMVPTNTPRNDPSTSLGDKSTLHQDPPLGFGNQSAPLSKSLRMVEKDEVAQANETTKDVLSESASESMVDILLGNETIDQVSQDPNRDNVECGLEPSQLVHNELENPNLEFQQTPLITDKLQPAPPQPQSVEPGFKPSELVHNELKSVNFELNQTPLIGSEPLEPKPVEVEHNPSELVQNEPKSLDLEPPATGKPQSLPPDPVNEPMDIVTENPISPKNDILQDMQSELAAKDLRNNENGKTESNAGDYIDGGGLQSTTGTLEGVQTKPEFAGEECVFPGRVPGQAADVDFGVGDVIPPTQSHWSGERFVSESENR